MILYYIEDSITELNILTANRPDSIKGLATLTGHDTYKGSAARGRIRLSLKTNSVANKSDYTISIPNGCKVVNLFNNLTYTIILSANDVKIGTNMADNVDANIIQGEYKYQSATGTGQKLQSFNFAEKSGGYIDEYSIRVFVNGEAWKRITSILDMGRNEECYIARSGVIGGVDLFFGNGVNGAVPPIGSTIQIEYVKTQGVPGNVQASNVNKYNSWKFLTKGVSSSGESTDLNDVIGVTCLTDIILGTAAEDSALTRMIAPHASRSFVLANKVNYKYFLQRMNMFSVVDVFKGMNTFEDM